MCGNPYHIPLNAAIRVASSTYTNSRLPRIACKHLALPVFTPAAPKWLGGRAPYVARRSGYFFPFFFPPDPAPAPLFLLLLYAAYALFLGFPALLSSSFFFAFAARFKASASASRLRRSSGVPSSSVKAGHG